MIAEERAIDDSDPNDSETATVAMMLSAILLLVGIERSSSRRLAVYFPLACRRRATKIVRRKAAGLRFPRFSLPVAKRIFAYELPSAVSIVEMHLNGLWKHPK
jgi:hypothetical protein